MTSQAEKSYRRPLRPLRFDPFGQLSNPGMRKSRIRQKMTSGNFQSKQSGSHCKLNKLKVKFNLSKDQKYQLIYLKLSKIYSFKSPIEKRELLLIEYNKTITKIF